MVPSVVVRVKDRPNTSPRPGFLFGGAIGTTKMDLSIRQRRSRLIFEPYHLPWLELDLDWHPFSTRAKY